MPQKVKTEISLKRSRRERYLR